jgi:hypothetical protein
MKVLIGLSLVLLALGGAPNLRTSPTKAESEVLLKELLKANLEDLSFDEVIQIIGGVLTGLGQNVNTPDLAPCVTDAGEFGGNIAKAVQDFSKDTFDGTKDGFMDLSNAFGALPGFVHTCIPAANETVTVLVEVVKTFAHPLSLIFNVGKDIIFNGQDIFADISEALGAYEAQEWFTFGEKIGDAAYKIIYVPSDVGAPEPEDTKAIMHGFIKRVYWTHDIQDEEYPELETQFAELANNLDGKTFNSVKDALSGLGEILNTIAPQLEKYEHRKPVDLTKIANKLINPSSFYYDEDNVLINGVSIGEKLQTAYLNYNMGNWKSLGYTLGSIVKSLDRI